MSKMVSIDPGEVHCGTAWWIDAECYEVKEYTPGMLFIVMERALRAGALDIVVIEEFRLYPDKAKEQGYSQMGTAAVIGVLRYLTTRWSHAELVMQGASIKKPTRGHMNAKRIPNRAVVEKAGGHCSDAVLHGQYYLMHGSRKG